MASHTRSPSEPPVERERELSPTSAFERSIESQAAESPLPAASKRERGLRLAERLVLASGIVLFIVLLARLGVETLVANLGMVGWGILLIIAAEMLAFLLNTVGWRAAFSRGGSIPSFGRLLLARIAGDGVNYLTPTATMGGEFVRVRMLQAQAPNPALAASVLVAKLTQTAGLVAYVSSGLFIVLDKLRLPIAVKIGILGSLALFAVMLLGLLLLQRGGPLASALRFTSRWTFLRFLAPLRSSAERIDVEMARVHPGRVVLSSTAFALGFACGIIETYLILWCFRVPTSFQLVLAIDVLGVALANLTFFIPLRLGTQEAGKAVVFALLGLSPAQGLAAGVVCRVRELTWALIGLAILARSHLSIRSLPGSMDSSALHARR